MHSLRARLLAAVLALAGAGLLVLGAITYTEQHSFLYDRLDQEARAAAPVLDTALHAEAGLEEGERAAPSAAGGAPQGAAPPNARSGAKAGGSTPALTPPLAGSGPNANGYHGPGYGGNAPPPGTYGQLRSASGTVLRHHFLSFGGTTPPEPVIPKKVPVGEIFTVGSKGSSGLKYVAYAHASPNGLLTIAAIPTTDVQQQLNHLLLVEGLVIAGVLVLLALAASWAVRLGLAPLDRIARTASEIAAGDLSRRVSPATQRTEVGRLGLALNDMLARLERAFAEKTSSEQRLRRFLADASHELRTPLASIRGYAELFRMGAARDPEEVELAMRRIEEEAARMGTLVEDLLVLARLDQTRERPRGRVDLAALAADAVADARAIAPGRRITLEDSGAAIVAGDADQLRQVLANLTRNALVHTPAGTAVELALQREGHSLKLTVRDHGPGLPAGGEDMFERFWRTEGGRERGKAGAGLGLAITRTIVEAHRGTITASQADGGGALFTVLLPAADAPAGAPDHGATHSGESASAGAAPAPASGPGASPGTGVQAGKR